VQTTAWTGSAPGLTYTSGESTQVGLSADIFDFGTGNTVDMQNCSVLFDGATVQNFAPGSIYALDGQYLYVVSAYSGGSATNVAFTYDTNVSGNVKQTFYGTMKFGNNGEAPVVDFADAIVLSTPASPEGGTDLVGEAATIIVTNGPNLNWNSTGAFANGITFVFTVDGSGNATVSVNDGGTGHTVGETFSISGALVGGTSPADDVNFEITSLVESRTALSLTKQVQILEDGFYTLADGTEGQIMYFVPASGTTTGTYVVIENARIIDVGDTDLPVDDTDYSWTPFFGETEAPGTIAMAIFADGAWCLRGGVTD
jgi:hypothetical protein